MTNNLTEILNLLREIRTEISIGNYDERIKEIHRRIDHESGDKELIYKKILAIEKYFNISFDEGFRYKHDEKNKTP